MIQKQYKIRLEYSKNGEMNLIVNKEYYYSRYNPKKDIESFISHKINNNCHRYIVIGVGLGYHIKELLEQDDKEIILLETEREIFEFVKKNGFIDDYLSNPRVKFVHSFKDLNFNIEDSLIIIPAWKRHLENPQLKILVEQLEFELSKGANSDEMLQNFNVNINSKWSSIKKMENCLNDKTAILVSAGPDLDNQVEFLKQAKGKVFILCVSAAYKTLKEVGVIPNGIIAIDQRVEFTEQLDESTLNIPLFLLSTVHPSFTATNNHKFLLFQMGLYFTEEYAYKIDNPLIESHGSVATAGLSLLQYFNPKQIIFVGQDLAISKNKTHSIHSPSNYVVPLASRYKTSSNSGEQVETQLQWLVFKRHFEKMIANNPHIKYVNTSYMGAVIAGAEYIDSNKIDIGNESIINIEQIYS